MDEFLRLVQTDTDAAKHQATHMLLDRPDSEAIEFINQLAPRVSGKYWEPDNARALSYFLMSLVQTLCAEENHRRPVLVEASVVQFTRGQSHTAVNLTRLALKSLGPSGFPIVLEIGDRLHDHIAVGDLLSILAEPRVSEVVRWTRQRLTSPTIAVRLAAVKTLRRLGAVDEFDAIAPCCTDAEMNVRMEAAATLVSFAPRRSIPVITPLLNDPETWIQARVTEFLANIRSDEVVPVLLARLSTPIETAVLVHVLRALGKQETPDGVPALLAALGDQRPEVRGMAAWALGETADSTVLKELAGVADDPDELVRWSASESALRIRERA